LAEGLKAWHTRLVKWANSKKLQIFGKATLQMDDAPLTQNTTLDLLLEKHAGAQKETAESACGAVRCDKTAKYTQKQWSAQGG
jgi:hypothetical protein